MLGVPRDAARGMDAMKKWLQADVACGSEASVFRCGALHGALGKNRGGGGPILVYELDDSSNKRVTYP
jgi:hypothetical protein